MHPTRSDIAPLLLVEAAMFGCPAIASRAFAIPELVADGESGLLLDAPGDPAEVAAAMTLDAGQSGRLRRHARGRLAARPRRCTARRGSKRRLLGVVDEALADVRAAA